jgi:iron complex outermembrane receptor protein
MRSLFYRALVCLLVCAPAPFDALGQQQTSATITGVVTDPNGAVLAGARVSAKNVATRQTRHAVADEQGRYTLFNLAPGQYELKATGDNFLAVSREVSLGAAENLNVDFPLPLRPVSESVQVEAETELAAVPGGTALVPLKEIEQSRASNLKDVLSFTPGVLAQSRFGADESQLSIRGSGLRSNFHSRGVNLLINGLPYQDADGFGDYESLDLLATERVEVWKGANALRFGANSMGGAINFMTYTGETAPRLQINLVGGAYGFFKGQISTGYAKGSFDYYLSVSDTEMSGFREHSDQGRQRFYGNLGWKLDENTDLRAEVIYANVAEKLPGALTRQEYSADPRQADPNNVMNDWGRFYDFVRVGARATRRIGNQHQIVVSLYGQYRNMDHPIFQVIDEDARSFGGEVRYSFNGSIRDRRNRLVVGFAPQFGNVGTRWYANTGGGRGAETNRFSTRARNYGLYFENQLDITNRLTLVAGGRADWATRSYTDLFTTDGDRSDRRAYKAFSPKVGFVWRVFEQAQIFGNVSRSYEAPLLLELTSFAGFGSSGFLDLKAQDTWQYELGTRGQINSRVDWDVAFFDAEIENEIINTNVRPFVAAPFTIPSYRNAPQTRHLGLEVGANALLKQNLFDEDDRLSWRTAYTWSRFRFVDDPTFGDNYIPGAPRHLLRSELRYEHPRGFWVAPNVDWSPSDYFADSANTLSNDSYGVLNLKAGYDWRSFGLYFEAANLTDRLYSASVVVDNELGRYLEPANKRSAFIGLRWRMGEKR